MSNNGRRKAKKTPITASEAGRKRWEGVPESERRRFMAWVARIRWAAKKTLKERGNGADTP